MSDDSKKIDFPLEEIARTCGEHLRKGHTFWQKFSCERCGARNTIDVPNQLYAAGTCGDCGHETDLRIAGCNFMLHIVLAEPTKGSHEAVD